MIFCEVTIDVLTRIGYIKIVQPYHMLIFCCQFLPSPANRKANLYKAGFFVSHYLFNGHLKASERMERLKLKYLKKIKLALKKYKYNRN